MQNSVEGRVVKLLPSRADRVLVLLHHVLVQGLLEDLLLQQGVLVLLTRQVRVVVVDQVPRVKLIPMKEHLILVMMRHVRVLYYQPARGPAPLLDVISILLHTRTIVRIIDLFAVDAHGHVVVVEPGRLIIPHYPYSCDLMIMRGGARMTHADLLLRLQIHGRRASCSTRQQVLLPVVAGHDEIGREQVVSAVGGGCC